MKKIIFILLFVFYTVITYSQCQASFFYISDSTGLTSFTDTSYVISGNIDSWYWDFGDGSTSTIQNDTHQYNYSGFYAVCLTITTDDSCYSNICDTINIYGLPSNPCNGFSVSLNTTNTTGQYAYNGSITTNTVGGIPPYSYNWDSGSNTANIEYLSVGNYCVTVTSFDSCVTSDCAYIYYDTLLFCDAKFNVISDECPNCFDFVDISNSSSEITSWYWDFFDGNTSSLQNPLHFFLDSGFHQVCLTIETIDSCFSTLCDTTIHTSYNLTTYSVSGTVYAGTEMVSYGTMELYSSNRTASHPPYYSEIIIGNQYNFPSVASGTYKLLANPGFLYTNTFSSTYFGNTTDYNDAYELSVIGDSYSVDIYLQNNTNNIRNNSISYFNVFPNPFEHGINIRSDKTVDIIKIKGISGKVVYYSTPKKENCSIQLSNLNSGIYFIEIIYQNSSLTKKIIKL